MAIEETAVASTLPCLGLALRVEMEAVACWLARLVANGVVLIAVGSISHTGTCGGYPDRVPCELGIGASKKKK